MPGLRGRIVAAVAAALVVVLVVGGPGLRRRAVAQSREQLLAEARLMARVVEPALAAGAGSAEIDAAVDAAEREVRARVTIVALDETLRRCIVREQSKPDMRSLSCHGAYRSN